MIAPYMFDSPAPTDTPALVRIAENAGVFSPREIQSIREMLAAFFDPTPDDDHIFFVYRDDSSRALRGLICFGPTPFTDRVYDLYWICVAPDQQRHGIGRALLRRMAEVLHTHAARAVYLETSDAARYQPAHALYESEGYHLAARLEDFYARGEAKLIYCKVFQNA